MSIDILIMCIFLKLTSFFSDVQVPRSLALVEGIWYYVVHCPALRDRSGKITSTEWRGKVALNAHRTFEIDKRISSIPLT